MKVQNKSSGIIFTEYLHPDSTSNFCHRQSSSKQLDNSFGVLPSASPIPRFYPSTKGATTSTKCSGRYSGLAQLFYRPSSHILFLSTILFTSLLFSSLTSYLPNSSFFQKNSFLIFLTTFPRLLPEGSLESQRLSMQLLHTAIS